MYQLSRFEFDDFVPESVVHFVLCCCGKTGPYAHRPSEVQKPRHSGFYSTCRDFAAAMASIIHPLLTLLASVTRQQLLQQITYLLAENRMLRSKLTDRINLSNQERHKLLRHGKKLGSRIKDLISIVSYSTFLKWVRTMEDTNPKRPKSKTGKNGRPRIEESLSETIIRIRKETAGDTPRLSRPCADLDTRYRDRRSRTCSSALVSVPNRIIIPTHGRSF